LASGHRGQTHAQSVTAGLPTRITSNWLNRIYKCMAEDRKMATFTV